MEYIEVTEHRFGGIRYCSYMSMGAFRGTQ